VQQAARSAGAKRTIPIHVLIETHGALENVVEIARLPHIEVLDFGLMDLISGYQGAIPMAAMRSPLQFAHPLVVRAKGQVAAAALAHGIVPAHNVCMNLKDTAVIGADAHRARVDFGFQRMWSIHPAQIQPIVAAMAPSMSELSDAAAILLLAQSGNWGPIQYQGEIQDRASYRYFWTIVRKAKSMGYALPSEINERFFRPESR
jgi:citrate lyase subunit beta/citryl-CoA lyase